MVHNKEKTVKWTGSTQTRGLDILTRGGGMIVTPTKVGYIIMTTDRGGLDRKFDAKVRSRNKPGVVLCGSMGQLRALAALTPEIDAFYQAHWDADILLGCILPWQSGAMSAIPNDGSQELVMDKRMTSCFVIRFGMPSEQLAEHIWSEHRRVAFASSANPSGKGNRGIVEGIGERIEAEADLIISANDYVASIQPAKNNNTRYEQGVMISMVDEAGKLVPEQKGERMVTPAPTLIRKGLDVDRIMLLLSEHFLSWDYRQGQYY